MIQQAVTDVTNRIYDHNIKVLTQRATPRKPKSNVRKNSQPSCLPISRSKVKRYPNDLSFKFDYGELLYARGDLDTAIAQFQQAQRNPQRRIDALYLMGQLFLQSKGNTTSPPPSFESRRGIATMDDTKVAILYELGEVLEAGNDLESSHPL